jgi:hypothetical protein
LGLFEEMEKVKDAASSTNVLYVYYLSSCSTTSEETKQEQERSCGDVAYMVKWLVTWRVQRTSFTMAPSISDESRTCPNLIDDIVGGRVTRVVGVIKWRTEHRPTISHDHVSRRTPNTVPVCVGMCV